MLPYCMRSPNAPSHLCLTCGCCSAQTLLYELSLSSTLSFKSREAEPEEQHELPTGGE
jgi:hypothetical protein